MKKLTFILLIFVLTSCIPVPVHAATYNGKDIDGYNFSCSFRDHGTWYHGLVVFGGLYASIYFNDGEHITIQLDQREIEDLRQIHGTTYNPYNNPPQSQYILSISETAIEAIGE